MTQNNKLLFFMTLLMFIRSSSQESKTHANTLSDWKKDTFEYAKETIQSKIINNNTGEEIPIILQKAHITKIDNAPAVLAVCAFERNDKETSLYDFTISDRSLAMKHGPLLSIFRKTFHTLTITEKTTGDIVFNENIEISSAYAEKSERH